MSKRVQFNCGGNIRYFIGGGVNKYDIKNNCESKLPCGTVPKGAVCAYNMFQKDAYCTILYCNISQFLFVNSMV